MTKIVYLVKVSESERGLGKHYYYEYFNTYEKAENFIKEVNKKNEDDYKETKSVPDYYIQVDDIIQSIKI